MKVSARIQALKDMAKEFVSHPDSNGDVWTYSPSRLCYDPEVTKLNRLVL